MTFSEAIDGIRDIINRSKYEVALDQIEKLEDSTTNNHEHLLLEIEKSRIFEYTGKFDASQDILSQISMKSEYKEDPEIQIRGNITLSRIHWKLGQHNESKQIIEKSLALLDEGNIKKEYIPYLQAQLFNIYGNVLRALSFLDEALNFHRKSLILWEKLNDYINAALSLNNIGIIHFNRGDYNLALLYLVKHLNIVKSLNHKKYTAVALNNVGEVYRIRGDLDKSLEFIKQSLSLKEELGDKLSTIYTLQNIGLIENNMGEFKKSVEHLQLALNYAEELGNPILLAEILFHLIHVYDHENDRARNLELLKRLERIAEVTPQPEIILHAKLAKALILKSQKRLKNIIEAEQILEEVINGEVIIHNLLIFALKHLCEIYLVELKITGKEQVMNDIHEIIDRLYEIGHKNQLYQTLIEALILKSKIAMVNNEFSDTIKYLNQAEELALSKKLTTIMKFIKSEKELFQSEISKWTELLDRNQDVSSRVELVKLASYLKDVQQFLSN